MGLDSGLEPATGMFAGSIGRLASNAFWLIPIVIIAGIALGAFVWYKKRDKDRQWTHSIRVRRVLENNLLSKEVIHRMRRFPLIKNAEVFELEKPILGSYLIPELDEYSGLNQYSLIIDKNNRLYTNLGDKFDPNSAYVKVSARHAEIDIEHSDLKAKYQNINKISKRIEWATIAKYAMWSVFIVAVAIVSIVAIQNWGEAQAFKAQEARATEQSMNHLNEALDTIEGTKNTDILIIDKLRDLYGTKNLQVEIERARDV